MVPAILWFWSAAQRRSGPHHSIFNPAAQNGGVARYTP